MSDKNRFVGPLKARSDLIDILRSCPENTEAIVALIQAELSGMKDGSALSRITAAINTITDRTDVSGETKDNLLYWLTESSPDARQMIMVRTIEELLGDKICRPAMIEALSQISSKDNVDMVMKWVDANILTPNQAVFVLLFPEASPSIK